MSLNLPISHACNTSLSRKQRQNITENVTNPPYLGAQLKKYDQVVENWRLVKRSVIAEAMSKMNWSMIHVSVV